MSAPIHPEPAGGHLDLTEEVAMLMRSMEYEEFMALADSIGVPAPQLHAFAVGRSLRGGGASGLDVRPDDLPAIARRAEGGV